MRYVFLFQQWQYYRTLFHGLQILCNLNLTSLLIKTNYSENFTKLEIHQQEIIHDINITLNSLNCFLTVGIDQIWSETEKWSIFFYTS